MSSVPKNDTPPSKRSRSAPARPGNTRLREVDPEQWSAQKTPEAPEAADKPPADGSEPTLWRSVLELTKPEISFLVALSAAAGFLLGSRSVLDLSLLAHTVLGTTITAGGSGMLNHFFEHSLDARMKRTSDRPLPAGRITPRTALYLGLAMAFVGTGYLYIFTNALAAGLAAATVGFYLLVYTPLKRITKYNTLIGCIPGALPPLGGWVAATGSLDAQAWILFGVLFAWQMPHFLALAWMYRTDYGRAGFVMLPVVEPNGGSTARQTIGFAAATVGLSTLPFFTDLTGWLYLAGTAALGVYFLAPAVHFYRERSNQNARRVLKASVVYIPALLALISLDKLV